MKRIVPWVMVLAMMLVSIGGCQPWSRENGRYPRGYEGGEGQGGHMGDGRMHDPG